MLDYHRLWKLSDAMQNDAFRVKSEDKMDREVVRKLKRGEARPRHAIAYRFYMGQVPKDLIGTGWAGQFILSDRIVSLLRTENFTGWSTYPVLIISKDGSEIPGYHGLAITGRCGSTDKSQSQKIKQSSDGQFVRVRGLFFDEKTWDRSDIFMTGVAGHICVTEAVHDTIVALKPTNIKFTRLDEATGLLIRQPRPAS